MSTRSLRLSEDLHSYLWSGKLVDRPFDEGRVELVMLLIADGLTLAHRR